MEKCEVFGETLEAENQQDLREMVLSKLKGLLTDKDAERELHNKKLNAKLVAKSRL